MNFDKNNNLIINTILFIITIGLVAGTGSLYRFLYSYNLIMFVTLLLMVAILSYQFFIPSFSVSSSNLQYNPNHINYSGLLLTYTILFFAYLSDIINVVESLEILVFYSAILLISILLNKGYRDKIFNYYLKIIVSLSVTSLIFTIITLFKFDLSVFPHISTDILGSLDFYFVWSSKSAAMLSRNQSIFWEPGAFGYHIIIASLLAYKRNNKFFIIILIVTGITTFSTTVFFFLFLIYLYHLIYGRNRVVIFICSVLIISIVIIVFGDTIGKNPLIKLVSTAIFEKFTKGSSTYISFAGRSLYIIDSFKIFLDNIFLGVGQYGTAVKLETVHSGAAVNSSGLIGLIAELGFIGIFCIFLYIRFFDYFKIIAIPITLIWLNGEFLQYSPMSLLMLADATGHFAKKIFP